MKKILLGMILCLALAPLAANAQGNAAESGFTPLFDGKTLNGWQLVRGRGPGYVVKDGTIVCPLEGGGNLLTAKEYANFAFRFEFKTEPGGNNGIGIRTPLNGDAAYVGMEIQILDDGHEKYKGKIKSEQHHGSVYLVAPARTLARPGRATMQDRGKTGARRCWTR